MESANNLIHELKITDRNFLSLSGVNKIISFDNTEFILETNLGPLDIRGEQLELLSLDLQANTIKIKGNIHGFNYFEKNKRKKEESIIAKLFKWVHTYNF